MPLGNVYYYFKTKEALGEALVDRLTGMYESLCAQCRHESDGAPARATLATDV